MPSTPKRKIFVVDTSVLLHDKFSIHSFRGNDVVLPLIVLDELDKSKERTGIVGENARYVNRFLDEIRKYGKLSEGIYLPEYDQNIKISILKISDADEKKNKFLELNSGDNKIIFYALELKKKLKKDVTVVTKDINLRVKCESLGLHAEDYYNDYKNVQDHLPEYKFSYQVSDSLIDELYDNNCISLSSLEENIGKNLNGGLQNSFIILEGDSKSKSALCIQKKDVVLLLTNVSGKKEKNVKKNSLEQKNKEQRFAIHILNDEKIPLVCLTGLAGSGKTYVALVTGIDALMDKKYDRIVITRSIQPVGKDVGFLPGNIEEKMAPWLAPIIDNYSQHFKDKKYFATMMDNGDIEIAPLTYIRGRSFNNTYLIVDEAQNTTIHELKTIITRVGENSKVVLMGDTDQIDTPYIDKRSNGLSIVIDKFKNNELMSHIHLTKGERSALATEASKIL